MPLKIAVFFKPISSAYDVFGLTDKRFCKAFEKQGHKIFFDQNKWLDFKDPNYKKLAYLLGNIKNETVFLEKTALQTCYVINSLADHPYYYFPVGQSPKNVIPELLDNSWLNSLHWQNKTTPPHHALIFPATGFQVSKNIKPITERPISVLWASSMTPPAKVLADYKQQFPELSQAFHALAQHLRQNQSVYLFDEFLRQNLEALLKLTPISLDDVPRGLNALRQLYHFLDKYQRQTLQQQLLTALLRQKVAAHIYTNSAEVKAKYGHHKQLHIHAAIPYQAYEMLNTDAKIVISNTYQNGLSFFSERIPQALLNGAVPATSTSPFIEHQVSSDEVILANSNLNYAQRTEQLVDKIRTHLKDEDTLQQMANRGQEKALQKFTPEAYVIDLIKQLEQLNLPD